MCAVPLPFFASPLDVSAGGSSERFFRYSSRVLLPYSWRKRCGSEGVEALHKWFLFQKVLAFKVLHALEIKALFQSFLSKFTEVGHF